MKPQLEKLFREKCTHPHANGAYTTDKGSDHDYILGYYASEFEGKQDSVTDILEIGVMSGGSLMLWHHYFNSANIEGIDIGKHVAEIKEGGNSCGVGVEQGGEDQLQGAGGLQRAAQRLAEGGAGEGEGSHGVGPGRVAEGHSRRSAGAAPAAGYGAAAGQTVVGHRSRQHHRQ